PVKVRGRPYSRDGSRWRSHSAPRVRVAYFEGIPPTPWGFVFYTYARQKRCPAPEGPPPSGVFVPLVGATWRGDVEYPRA
ncbi:MAG: hypothetical protein J7452_11060, partial [Thermoflexus sp.]|nr:hypothetical protein [Thermoflexus sp.]